MKHAALLAAFAIVAISACQPPAVDIEAETAAVKTVLEEYVKSIETEDMEAYAKLYHNGKFWRLWQTDYRLGCFKEGHGRSKRDVGRHKNRSQRYADSCFNRRQTCLGNLFVELESNDGRESG